MKEELHLFIIWQNARDKQNEILDDIKQNFEIIQVYDMEWSKEKFANNLTRFYGTNLPAGSGKEVHCGNGKFLLIIVKDLNPVYEDRKTSKGTKYVNIHLFDKKDEYRMLTGGGHKIHATNNEIETNHDLTLLLGKNVEDYLRENSQEWNGQIQDISQDLIGSNGWNNATQMFYALNNCVNYAILRNYESLPEEIYVNEHNDIDLICESMEEVAYVLNAKPMHSEPYRVQHEAKVEDKYAYFDLRHIGDDYYDRALEERILKNRVFNEKGFYVLEKQDYFYTLLYHAFVQKPEFKKDYKIKLKNMGIEKVNENTTMEEYGTILKKWMLKNEYSAVKPIDKTVFFVKENLEYLKPLVYREEKIEPEETKIDELNIINEQLIHENANLQARNKELENRLAGIIDSRSWKMMEPIRNLIKKLKS